MRSPCFRRVSGCRLLSDRSLLLAVAVVATCTAGTVTVPVTTHAATTPAAAPAAARLISREDLFGNPVKAAAKLSPDGKWLSWLAPVDGVINVWVAPAADPAAARSITADKTRPIREYFWSPDSKAVLYLQDKGGDENFLLYAVDPVTGAERNLTPFAKTRVMVIGTSSTIRDRILIALNNRDPRFHDVYSLDLGSGKLTKLLQNDAGFSGFTADDGLVLRLVNRSNAAGGQDYFKVAQDAAGAYSVAGTPFAATTLDDALTTAPAGYTNDGKTLYWIDSRGRDTAALVAQDVASGATRILAQDPRADIGSLMGDPGTGAVDAFAVNYLTNEWHGLAPRTSASLAFLKSRLKGDFEVLSRTFADDKWIVANDPITEPSVVWLYDRTAGTLTKLFTPRPALVGAPLAGMVAREIKARDGLTLVSYLTLPYGSDPDGDGVPDHPVPMVLFVHGGPWARDDYGTNRYLQWLANRGYAVLAVNYRGSTGFGKAFIKAGNLQWGRKMQDDLDDAVAWAIANKVTTAGKVAIMGGSYGGYATLAGMTFTPKQYACGVDIVGPSNLETLLKTIPPYWAPIVSQFHQRMGDPSTPEGLALLKAASPLYKADQIQRPLLIGQGANDPRVNKAESDQIVAAMKARSIPVAYVLFPDEGHGFAKPANNIAFNAVAENFLAPCLGGRAEPIGDALAKSTAQVLDGAAMLPGLAAR